MANAIDEAEGLTGIVVMIAVLAIIVWLFSSLSSLFGDDKKPASGPSAPKNPLGKIKDFFAEFEHPFAGNPDDPGYDFFYGSDAYSWAALKKWMAGKWQETVTPEDSGNAARASTPGSDADAYSQGTGDPQLDQELQPW